MKLLRDFWRRITGARGRAIERMLEQQQQLVGELRRTNDKQFKQLKGQVSRQQKISSKQFDQLAVQVSDLDDVIRSKQGLVNRVERVRRQVEDLARRELLALPLEPREDPIRPVGGNSERLRTTRAAPPPPSACSRQRGTRPIRGSFND